MHHHQVFLAHLTNGHLKVLPVAAHACGLRTQGIQRTDSFRGLAFGPGLEPFTQQHQRDDDGGGLKIQMVSAVAAVHQQFVQAEPIPGRCSQRHQQVHVSSPGFDGLPARSVEPGAKPELDWRGQRQLPVAGQHPVGTKEPAEHWNNQGQGKQCRYGNRPPGIGVWPVGVAGLGPGCKWRTSGIPGVLDSCQQCLDIRSGVAQSDLGHFGREIDLCGSDSWNLFERLFDARHARCAGHAVDRQCQGYSRCYIGLNKCLCIHGCSHSGFAL
jgi:hypothetical protein